MNDNNLEKLLDNEREWRRYLIERVEEHRKDLTHIKIWNTVFRIAGGILLSLFYVWVDHKIK